LSWLRIVFGVDADILRMPDFDIHSLWYLAYFLVAILTLIILVQWRVHKQSDKNSLSNRFMQITMRRGLTKVQLAAVDVFFKTLNPHEQDEIMLSQKALANHLHQYLDRHPALSATDRVEIFDKLLPGIVSQIEIKSVADLRIGELAAIDINKKSILATILKTKDNQILLSLSEKIAATGPAAAHIYAYRPNLGGFLMEGQIIKSNGQSIVFQFSGKIDFRGDQHLMTQVAVGFEITRWPKPEVEIDGEKTPETAELGHDQFNGYTEKLSDRAMLVNFATKPPEWVIKKQEYWEMKLELPENPLVCRVKITPYKTNYTWLVRPVDLDAADRNRLYRFISANEPVREHF
jgi:hypothetical protein